MSKKISVVGLGYIGLPTAAMFADHGAKVIGVDVNQYAIDTINQGKIHIVEPGLEDIVKKAVTKGLFKASNTPEPADAFLIAVPTPFKGNDHTPDLSYIESAIKAIAPVVEKGNIIILESTSPVGATEKMVKWLKDIRKDLSFAETKDDVDVDVNIAYCPERVLPGKVVEELISNDRIIGGITKECADKAKSIYKIFVKGNLLVTNARTAEMSKLTENAFRDVNIAFANELSIISDKLGIDVWELIDLANHHPRVNILQPGAGVGGHCIAVDPWFIVNKTPEEAKLIKAAREVNDNKPNWVVNKINTEIDKLKLKGISKPKVALLGLSFKPNIDDLRESPAIRVVKSIMERNDVDLVLVEPNIDFLPNQLLEAKLLSSSDLIQEECHLLFKLVAHDQFSEVNGLTSFVD